MQKIEYTSCIYQIKFNTLPNNENSQQKSIAKYCFDHSADIDYEGFLKIYRRLFEDLHKPYSVLTIDTKLLANKPMRFIKNF